MIDREALEVYLDQWMADYGRPMHATAIECVVEGVVEFLGQKRSQAEWWKAWEDSLNV